MLSQRAAAQFVWKGGSKCSPRGRFLTLMPHAWGEAYIWCVKVPAQNCNLLSSHTLIFSAVIYHKASLCLLTEKCFLLFFLHINLYGVHNQLLCGIRILFLPFTVLSNIQKWLIIWKYNSQKVYVFACRYKQSFSITFFSVFLIIIQTKSISNVSVK